MRELQMLKPGDKGQRKQNFLMAGPEDKRTKTKAVGGTSTWELFQNILYPQGDESPLEGAHQENDKSRFAFLKPNHIARQEDKTGMVWMLRVT